MNIGKSSDITNFQSLSFKDSQVLMAFLHGHIIKYKGDEFRFARKDQALFTEDTDDGVIEYVATETSLFVRTYTFDSNAQNYTPDEATGFKWIAQWGDSLAGMMGMISSMSEDEKNAAIHSLSFDMVVRDRQNGRAV